ncbi:hypothetical protein MJH12_10365 [bacterium]|nr:hypothetical protein [bacterium]
MLHLFLFLVATISATIANSTDQVFNITNNVMFDILVMIPGVLICSLVRGFVMHRMRSSFGDNNGSRKPSMDPFEYIDAYGSLSGIALGFCWPRPVDYYPRNFDKPIPNEILMYVMMSFANFTVSLVSLTCIILLLSYGAGLPPVLLTVFLTTLKAICHINWISGIFCFLPIHGLPGYLLLIRHLDYKTVFKLQDYLSLSVLLGMLALMFGQVYLYQVSFLLNSLFVSFGVIALSSITFFLLLFLSIFQYKLLQKH